MVDLVEIQAAYYMVAATGVLVAAAYYIINMRNQIKVRELETCKYLTNQMTSDPALQTYSILLKKLEWRDHEDFMGKYGYSNPEMFGKWASWFFLGDTIGYVVRNRLARSETIYELGGWGFIRLWERYKDFILSRRGEVYGRDYFAGFEFLAGEMLKIKIRNDASFNDKLETYRRTWKP